MDDKIFETFQTFCQYGTRAGDVPTHEAFAFLAVHGSGIEPKPGFPGQAVFQFGRRRSQCTAVHPHQISTLQFANRKVRKVFRAEFFHVPVIPLQVCQQLVEPVLPLAVCGYGGDYSERIDVAHLVDVDGFVDSSGATMLAICSPAMLNALLGDMQVTACPVNVSGKEAKGM